MTEPTKNDYTTYCKVCGGTNVQYAAWVNPNTNEVLECFGTPNYGDNTYCVDCDANDRDPNPDLTTDPTEIEALDVGEKPHSFEASPEFSDVCATCGEGEARHS